MPFEDKTILKVESAEMHKSQTVPIQSANTLFRFFTKLDYLLGTIEKSALIPRYYPETVDYLKIDRNHIAYPMICFCDINLHKMASHIDFYGGYGIAFSKDWGIKQGIQPIQYVNPNSPMRKDFTEAFKYAIDSETEDAPQNFLLSQMYYLKPIIGTMQREDEERERIFTDECEWRYIPNLSELELPQAVDEQDIFSLPMLNKAIDAHENAWLKFSYLDIKYLIVQSESDFEKLCRTIYKCVENINVRNLLISKIIVWECERSDF